MTLRTVRIHCLVSCAAALVIALGCNRQGPDADGPRAAGEKRAANPPAEKPLNSAATSPEPHSDSPSHPAVSDRVAPDAEAPASDVPPSDPSAEDGAAAHDAASSPGDKPKPLAPPPGALPPIALTAAHRATCKAFAGDTLPPMSLADLDGTPAPLDKLFGERLTVVLFWQHADADGVEAVDDLGSLVLEPYGKRGVRAVAVHVGATTDEVKAIVQRNHATYPVLVDADAAALAQVAGDVEGLMPRIFLVDAAGRILWFDIEYSRTTRRDLDLALRYLTRP